MAMRHVTLHPDGRYESNADRRTAAGMNLNRGRWLQWLCLEHGNLSFRSQKAVGLLWLDVRYSKDPDGSSPAQK